MERHELNELHYLLPMQNIASVLQRGILSHASVSGMAHSSIAMGSVQQRRAVTTLPTGKPLHTYANLYINGRNAMLYCRLDQRGSICILRVDPAVLDIRGTYVSDKNAAAGWPRFEKAPDGLKQIDRARVFAKSWNHADELEKVEHRAAMCAEVLVPNCVPRGFILGAYVCGPKALARFRAFGAPASFACTVDTYMFFGCGD